LQCRYHYPVCPAKQVCAVTPVREAEYQLSERSDKERCADQELPQPRLWPHDSDHGGDIDRHHNRPMVFAINPVEQEQNRTWPAQEVLSVRNKSGIQGVSFCNTRQVWYAHGYLNGQRIQLYRGVYFELAVEARIEFEDYKHKELMF